MVFRSTMENLKELLQSSFIIQISNTREKSMASKNNNYLDAWINNFGITFFRIAQIMAFPYLARLDLYRSKRINKINPSWCFENDEWILLSFKINRIGSIISRIDFVTLIEEYQPLP